MDRHTERRMTLADTEMMLEKLMPKLKKRLVHTTDEEDLFQQACIDIYKKADRLPMVTEKQFISTFESFYRTLQWEARTHLARKLSYGTATVAFCTRRDIHETSIEFNGATRAVDWDFINPWDTLQTVALEFIQELPNERMQRIFLLYYIEGWTLCETAGQVGLRKSRVQQLLTEGIHYLQERHVK